MKTLRKEVVASVGIAEVSISQDEIEVCETALTYLLDNLGDAEIERRFGATRDEVEGIRDDLRDALRVQADSTPLAEMAEKS